jgi:hypothetical protein
MRLREITETRQLNEVAPLAFLAPVLPGAVAWIATASLVEVGLWAVSAYGAWTTAKEIQKAIDENGPDPSNWPTELQDDLLGQIIGGALLAAAPVLKPLFQKMWSKVPADVKRVAFDKLKPRLQKELEKTANKSAGSPGTKNPNNIERPFSKDAGTKTPNSIERPFSKDPAAVSPANSAGLPPKNPNLVDRPYQKEELLRLAGLVK